MLKLIRYFKNNNYKNKPNKLRIPKIIIIIIIVVIITSWIIALLVMIIVLFFKIYLDIK